MKKIKHWWRKQEPIFKKDFKFQAIVLCIAIVFGVIAPICIVMPLIVQTLMYSDVFRRKKYFYVRHIKLYKDHIHILKYLYESQKSLIVNLEGIVNTHEVMLNSTYVFVPWPESQKFTTHKRFNECFIVENGCMIPYNIYKETLINLENNGN